MTESRKHRTGQVWDDRKDEFEERIRNIEKQINYLIELVADLGLEDDED